jgi:hypothetical protein
VLQLTCIDPNDGGNKVDEIRLRLDGRTVYSGHMRRGTVRGPLAAFPVSNFQASALLHLLEADGWPNKDDNLGYYRVNRPRGRAYRKELTFNNHGATYRLVLYVRP